MAYDLSEAFEAIENELIGSMMRNLKRHRAEETMRGFEWEQWQALQLRALEEYRRRNAEKFPPRFSKLNGQIDAMLKGSYRNGGTEQERKILAAIRRGIAVNRPDANDALDVLAKLGGFDLAGLCGVFLGGALYRIPVLIDGFPAAAAALCALRLCPAAGKAMLASHVSAEPAGALLLRALGKEAFLTAGMRLGEGSGAVAAMPLLDMALAVYRECYTFSEGGIAPYRRL